MVDIMPDDERVIGFSNPWYKPGLQNLITYSLPDGPDINLLSLPYFIATKFSAFRGRGENQYRTSHDFEDIIYLTDNCMSIVSSIESIEGEVKNYLREEYKQVWNNEYRTEIISCHLSPLIREERLAIIESKIQQIIAV